MYGIFYNVGLVGLVGLVTGWSGGSDGSGGFDESGGSGWFVVSGFFGSGVGKPFWIICFDTSIVRF